MPKKIPQVSLLQTIKDKTMNYHYKRKKQSIGISIDAELYDKLNQFAKSERRSMSNVIELLLNELFETNN